MGVTHSAIKSKYLERTGDVNCKVGSVCMQGCRMSMEDAHCIVLSVPNHPRCAVFGVFDGHCGTAASEFCSREVPRRLSALQKLDRESLAQMVVDMDLEFCKEDNELRDHGTTAVFAVLERDEQGGGRLVVVNAGDSRCVLGHASADCAYVQAHPAQSVEQATETVCCDSPQNMVPMPTNNSNMPFDISAMSGGRLTLCVVEDENGEEKIVIREVDVDEEEEGEEVTEVDESEDDDEKDAEDIKEETTTEGDDAEHTMPTVDADAPSLTAEEFENMKTPKLEEEDSLASLSLSSCDGKILSCTDGEAQTWQHEGFVYTEMSEDHKPGLPSERTRIQKAKGWVVNNRVDGRLALSRAVGDFEFKNNPKLAWEKQRVIPHPDIKEIQLSANDLAEGSYLAVFCDGIVEHMDNKEVASILHTALHDEDKKHDPAVIAAELCEAALESGSQDNMSVVLVTFGTDGVSYAKEGEYRPGPMFKDKDDERFMESFIKDAIKYGMEDGPQLRLLAYTEDEKELQHSVAQLHQKLDTLKQRSGDDKPESDSAEEQDPTATNESEDTVESVTKELKETQETLELVREQLSILRSISASTGGTKRKQANGAKSPTAPSPREQPDKKKQKSPDTSPSS